MEDTIDSLQWIANYYHRQNSISREKLVQDQGAKVLVYGMAGAGKTS